jgi:hypothetical protein
LATSAWQIPLVVLSESVSQVPLDVHTKPLLVPPATSVVADHPTPSEAIQVTVTYSRLTTDTMDHIRVNTRHVQVVLHTNMQTTFGGRLLFLGHLKTNRIFWLGHQGCGIAW